MKKTTLRILTAILFLFSFTLLYLVNTPVAKATKVNPECPNGCIDECSDGCYCYGWHPRVKEYGS